MQASVVWATIRYVNPESSTGGCLRALIHGSPWWWAV